MASNQSPQQQKEFTHEDAEHLKKELEEIVKEDEAKCLGRLQLFGCICCLCTLCLSWVPFCCYTKTLGKRAEQRMQAKAEERDAARLNTNANTNPNAEEQQQQSLPAAAAAAAADEEGVRATNAPDEDEDVAPAVEEDNNVDIAHKPVEEEENAYGCVVTTSEEVGAVASLPTA